MKINTITPNTINRRYNSIPFKSEKEPDNNSGSTSNIGYYRPNQDVTQFNHKIAPKIDKEQAGGIVYNIISKVLGHNHHSEQKVMNKKQLDDYMLQRIYSY